MAAQETYPLKFDYERFDVPENINLSVYLGPHFNEKDLPPSDELTQILKSSDITIVEAVGANYQRELKVLSRVAKGDFKAYQNLKMAQRSGNVDWKKAFYSSLYGSKTTPVIVDIPESHPGVQAEFILSEALGRAALLPDFDTAVDVFAQVWPQRLTTYQQRDQFILESIMPNINKAIESNSRLDGSGRPLNVTMLYGGVHAPMIQALLHKAKLKDDKKGFAATVTEWRGAQSADRDSYVLFHDGKDISDKDHIAKLVVHKAMSVAFMNLPDLRADIIDFSGGALEEHSKNVVTDKSYGELRELHTELGAMMLSLAQH